ncbi:MAG TPA: hypothetical protein VGM50_11185 [Gemmatimonadaceae bacterium]
MRTIRAFTVAAAIVAALPTIAAAQAGRPFTDAWFWGVKAGGLSIGDSLRTSQAGLVGLDWLITRHYGGLYVSGAEAFFNRQTFTFHDPSAIPDSGFRPINLKNMRKVDVALMGFPGDHLTWHPYVGVGFSYEQIVSAAAQPPFGNADQLAFADSVISQHKVSFAPLFMGGVQYRLQKYSVFGQASFSPMHSDFLLVNGKGWNFEYELGLRYNIGTSIDRNP